jgi:hypothetical protein
VLALETDQGNGTTLRRKLTCAATAQRLSGEEGGGPAAQGAALSSGKAPSPAHKGGKRVRQLGTDGVAKTEVKLGSDRLPEED